MTSTLFGSILYATRPSSSRPAWSVNPTQPQLTIFFFFATWSERRGKNALKNSLNHSECPPTMTQSASFVFSTTHAANSSSASLPHRSTFLFPSLFRASHDGI
uniref:Uncharacterized protein n=1 Tax=Micromonas pusilla TaxID=38833 RepID=A0A7R9T724_MICPS